MNSKNRFNPVFAMLRLALLLLALGASGSSVAQKATAKAAEPLPRIVLAINEGGAANADSTETPFKYQDFAEVVGKALRTQIVIVAVRDRDKLRNALKKHEYPLLLARPNDVPA